MNLWTCKLSTLNKFYHIIIIAVLYCTCHTSRYINTNPEKIYLQNTLYRRNRRIMLSVFLLCLGLGMLAVQECFKVNITINFEKKVELKSFKPDHFKPPFIVILFKVKTIGNKNKTLEGIQMTSIFAITMGSVKGGTGPQVSQQPNMQI